MSARQPVPDKTSPPAKAVPVGDDAAKPSAETTAPRTQEPGTQGNVSAKMASLGEQIEALTLKRKLLTLIVVATMAFVAVLTLGLATSFQTVLSLRSDHARSVVESAMHMVEREYALAAQGLQTPFRAKRNIINTLRDMRLDDGTTYVFITDDQAMRIILHPILPHYEGRDGIRRMDDNTRNIIRQFQELTRIKGGGFQTYAFPRPDDPTGNDVQKTAYITHFKPWGWIVGTGVYVDDVRNSFAELALTFAGLSTIVIILAVTVTVLISRDIVAPIARLEGALIGLSRGDVDQPIPDLNRWDEIGDMARALSVLQGGLVQKARLEGQLQQENANYRRIIETLDVSPEGISIHDSKGRMLYGNPAILSISGYEGRRQHAIGKRWSDLQGPGGTDPRALFDLSNEARARGQRFTKADMTWVRPNGEKRMLEVRMAQPDEGGIILIVSDRTDLARQEAEQKRLEAELERSRRTEALGRLAGGIAHDFNNILGAIMGFAEFLVRDLDKNTPQHRYARRILSSSDRAREVIEQVLAHSRASDAELVPLDVAHLIHRNENMLRPLISGNALTLAIEIEPEARLITRGHAGQLTQVMLNLLVNARDAMREQDQGQAILRLYTRPRTDMVDLRWPSDKDGIITESRAGGVFALRTGTLPVTDHVLVLELEDTGPGIPGAMLEHVVEPFNTTKRARGSSGLGLYVVTGIARAHKGALLIKSRPGHGTALRLYLPHHPELQPAPDVHELADLPDLPGGTERILLIDDETDLLDVLSIALERLGYEAAAISNPLDALELLSEMPDAFDLLVVDQIMPDLRGMELIRKLRGLGLKQPIILCTGHSDKANEESALAAGANAFFYKPVPHATLANAIRAQLDKQQDG